MGGDSERDGSAGDAQSLTDGPLPQASHVDSPQAKEAGDRFAEVMRASGYVVK